MIAVTVLLLVAAAPVTLPPPAEGLGLAPQPVTVTPAPPPPSLGPGPTGIVDSQQGGTTRFPPPWSRFFIPSMAVLLAAEAALRKRRGDVVATPPPGVDVIFVPGHGTSQTGSFEDLVEQMGLAPDQVHFFDWRTVMPGVDHVAASQLSEVGTAAAAIASFVDSVERPGRFVYLVGHSKGGAALAHLVAHWDDRRGARPKRVVGAALLDPPIAGGWHGAIQSVGLLVGPVPDDGGYDPMRPVFGGLLGHRDTRDNLGEDAGIEVVVIRNPDALVTNFRDEPEGLRVYDLDDRGPHPLLSWPNPVARMVEAHDSVLRHPAVALCLVGELWRAGGCIWTGGPPRPPGGIVWSRDGLVKLR